MQTHAQQTVPTCNRPNWNLLGPLAQSPCQVLSNFMNACAQLTGTSFNLTSVYLQPSGQYPRPEANETLALCKCTDVIYNLYSACGACQMELNHWQSHQVWFEGCSKLPPSDPIVFASPNQISLWMNQTYLPTFDIDKALQVQSTGNPLPAQSASNTTGGPTGGPGPSKSSNTSVIIGTILGGVIVILCILFFYYRRRRPTRERLTQLLDYSPPPPPLFPELPHIDLENHDNYDNQAGANVPPPPYELEDVYR